MQFFGTWTNVSSKSNTKVYGFIGGNGINVELLLCKFLTGVKLKFLKVDTFNCPMLLVLIGVLFKCVFYLWLFDFVVLYVVFEYDLI